MDEQREPFVWWVKLHDVPWAPTSLELRRNGTVLGRWREPNGSSTVHILTEDRMRMFGYEKCYCSPLDKDTVNERCPAHAAVCI